MNAKQLIVTIIHLYFRLNKAMNSHKNQRLLAPFLDLKCERCKNAIKSYILSKKKKTKLLKSRDCTIKIKPKILTEKFFPTQERSSTTISDESIAIM